MLEQKDISILLLGTAAAFTIPAVDSIRTRDKRWALGYFLVAVALAAWGLWPELHVSFQFPHFVEARAATAPTALETALIPVGTAFAVISWMLRRRRGVAVRSGQFLNDTLSGVAIVTLLYLALGCLFYQTSMLATLRNGSPLIPTVLMSGALALFQDHWRSFGKASHRTG